MVNEPVRGIHDSLFVGIRQDGGAILDEFHPFGFGSQHHATLPAEEGFFLQSPAVGQDKPALL